MDSIRSTLAVFFALFIISAGIFGLFVGAGTYAYNISSGELPMCNPNIATSQATVEVRNVRKPLITGKARRQSPVLLILRICFNMGNIRHIDNL